MSFLFENQFVPKFKTLININYTKKFDLDEIFKNFRKLVEFSLKCAIFGENFAKAIRYFSDFCSYKMNIFCWIHAIFLFQRESIISNEKNQK